MFAIGKLYHIVHVVDDLDAADRWYDEIFSVQRFYRGYHKIAMRDASLVAIGDLVMEPLMSSRVPGVEKSAIYKFHARFGQHLHSLAWYADDLAAAFETLRKHNIRLLGESGALLDAPPPRGGLHTHPRDTFGQLELARPGRVEDPRLQPGWSTAFWRDQHPLGIERASHITVAVGDLARAKAFYQQALGGRLIREESDAARLSAFFAIGQDTIVEAAQPLSKDTLLGQELERNGEIVHAVTFKVRDVARAEAFLAGKGLRIAERRAGSFVLSPQDAFGAVFAFAQRGAPGDPRP